MWMAKGPKLSRRTVTERCLIAGIRVHFPHIEAGIDLLHMFKCLLGTCVRMLNWGLAISLSLSMLRLLLGFTLSAFACSSLLSPNPSRLSLLLVRPPLPPLPAQHPGLARLLLPP